MPAWEVFTDPGTSCCRSSKRATRRHVNNVELRKRGRWRSNVWTYPGASSLGSDARRGLHDHPKVKPAAMLEDVLLDLTNRARDAWSKMADKSGAGELP
jgi:hypothetical protein